MCVRQGLANSETRYNNSRDLSLQAKASRFWPATGSDFVSYQDHVEKAWSVYAFDASHFDVRCCARSGDPSGYGRRLRAAGKVFGKCFIYLAGIEDAEVPVGKQGKYSTAFD